MGNDFGLTESLFSYVGSGLFVFRSLLLSYDLRLRTTLCPMFTLRSGFAQEGALLFVTSRPKAGPLTSRPFGPLLKRSARRRLTPHSLRLTPCGILRGCPERRGKYLRYALCALPYGSGDESVGRMCVSYGFKNAPPSS